MKQSQPIVEPLSEQEAQSAAGEIGVPEMMTRLSIFQVLLKHPKLGKPFNDLLMSLLFEGLLPVKLRELVIMRTGWVTGSEYEWTQHFSIAQMLGIDKSDLLSVRQWRSEPENSFTPAERAALRAVDDVAAKGKISEATYVDIRSALGSDAEVIELTMLVSVYAMVSSFLRSLHIPLEAGIDPWPPDGVSPPPEIRSDCERGTNESASGH
ncbi:MAG TPA: carboxymuconolactone decarboxylase family protein [Acidimicrobiales bacterium]|nr:carboxymuconolactone decarboxylase family protein [Acidimicrobiales bacterium]